MNITIVGTGYVGLVTAACFSEVGNRVLCVDIDEKKIAKLNEGEVPIHEPGLSELVVANKMAQRLMFSTSYDDAVSHGEIIFLAVGTPPGEDGSADLSHIIKASREIGKRITRKTIVVNKSTVPVGTGDEVRRVIDYELQKRDASVPFAVLSNPEFLKEGSAIDDFMRPDRIIVGGEDVESIQRIRELYVPFNRNHSRLMVMDIRSSELTKYAANAMLASRISFMNELADLADLLKADIESIRHSIGADPRIGPHFLYAGIGYGGSCFPKDVQALRKTFLDYGREPCMLNSIESVNTRQKTVIFQKLCSHFQDRSKLNGKVVALWGLAFKPNTNDMREAPSLILIDQLLRAGCRVQAYDPIANQDAKILLHKKYEDEQFLNRISFAGNALQAVEGADILVVVTEWKEFYAPDFSQIAAMLNDKALFDGRNLYRPERVERAGLSYYGIGRCSKGTFQ